MDALFEKTLLFDFYGELLTDNQKKIYEQHYLDDLSLGEISEQLNISRQGVFDTLKRCDHQLNQFEEKLQLVAKFISNKTSIEEIYQLTLNITNNCSIEDLQLKEQIKNIEQLTKNILENL